jgi:hypothetical protein
MTVARPTTEYMNRRPNVDRDPGVSQPRNLELPRRIRTKADLESVLRNPDKWELITQSVPTFFAFLQTVPREQDPSTPRTFCALDFAAAFVGRSQLPPKRAANYPNVLDSSQAVSICESLKDYGKTKGEYMTQSEALAKSCSPAPEGQRFCLIIAWVFRSATLPHNPDAGRQTPPFASLLF